VTASISARRDGACKDALDIGDVDSDIGIILVLDAMLKAISNVWFSEASIEAAGILSVSLEIANKTHV
jgi:hypothetical protein